MKLRIAFVFAVWGLVGLLLTSCEGIFSSLYDEVEEQPANGGEETIITGDDMTSVEGQIYVDASDWNTWTYINLEALANASLNGETDAANAVCVMDIPTQAIDADTETGIYTYWFDVFGQGLTNNERRSFYATVSQPEPQAWTIALHRETARTNGCAALETNYTSFDQLPASGEAFKDETFEADSWSERDVWVVQSQMLQGVIGCQGIDINKVLSGWYTCDIPPMPPAYIMNNHVFVLRLSDGTYAALQLLNHLSPTGTKCCFTIRYKYPY